MMSITKNTVVGLTSEGLLIVCATTRKRARHASLAVTNQDQLGLEIGGNPEEISAQLRTTIIYVQWDVASLSGGRTALPNKKSNMYVKATLHLR